ncbi:MAG: DUF2284 domain-containing protein [Eubacteriaceae bacterium]|jgi:predicted metal-binding protein
MNLTRRLNNPEKCGAQYIEDLSTAYWLSESLFTALGLNLFEYLEDGTSSVSGLARKTGTDETALCRFLHVLEEMKLVGHYQDSWYNTRLTSEFLTRGSRASQLGNVHWRQALQEDWATLPEALKAGRRVHFPEAPSEEEMDVRRRDYLIAMDAVVRPKIAEILPMLPLLSSSQAHNAASGKPFRILDLGCGSGAFSAGLVRYFRNAGSENVLSGKPTVTAELCDIRQIIGITEDLVHSQDPDTADAMTFTALNLLDESWALGGRDIPDNTEQRYDLIVLSNIVHAYDSESAGILKRAAECLSDDGLILIHDFFLDHDPLKSALSDMNMFINTYNGRSFSSKETVAALTDDGLVCAPLIPLSGDTAVLFAARSEQALEKLNLSPESRLVQPILSLGFEEVIPVNPLEIAVSGFAPAKCHFGCRSGGSKTCSINDEMSPEETKRFLSGYKKAFLLTGEPPTDAFQRRALAAETLAFKENFYKAFVFWAGPCSICPQCDPEQPCSNRQHHRPSMEGSGIDVFKTASNAGIELKTLSERGEFIRYVALLMLE